MGLTEPDPLARVREHLPGGAPWRIGVIGVGSVGSQVAESLARSGVRQLTVVDPDVVSAANLSRSVYRLADVGRPKVNALADRLRAVAGDRSAVEAIRDDATAVLGVGGPLTGLDLIVLATDDPVAELAVNRACYPAGVALVSLKLYRAAEAAEVIWVAPHEHSPCLRCLTVNRTPQYGRATDYGTGRLVAEPALGPDIAVVVPQGGRTVLALLAHRGADPATRRAAPARSLVGWFEHLAGRGKVVAVTGTVPGWNLFAAMADPLWADPWATAWIRGTRSPGCPVCGGRPARRHAGSATG